VRIRTIKPEDAAEFRGLFFGEGHIDMMKNGRAESLTVRLRVAVRDDDRAVVEWCRDLLGGWITVEPRTRSVSWALTGRHLVGAALDILAAGSLPSKKRAEVTLAREALALACPRGVHMSPESKARLLAIRDELKAARVYRSAAA
jgi:hypothetical protein